MTRHWVFFLLVLGWRLQAQEEIRVIKATMSKDFTDLEKEDMHACCRGFCGGNLAASSYLKDKSGIDYSVKNISDDNPHSAWVEGVDGDGIGEYISFTFTYDKKYERAAEGACYYKDEFLFVNGYQKNKQSFIENNRIKRLKVSVNDKTYYVDLLDKMGVQSVKFGFIKEMGFKKMTLKIKMEIVEVYKGSKYSDTAISEIFW